MFSGDDASGRKTARLDGAFGEGGAGVGGLGSGKVAPRELGQQVGMQLLASLSDSSDPITDAFEALAHAQLWLCNMHKVGLMSAMPTTMSLGNSSVNLANMMGSGNMFNSQMNGLNPQLAGLSNSSLANQLTSGFSNSLNYPAQQLSQQQQSYYGNNDRYSDRQQDRRQDRQQERKPQKGSDSTHSAGRIKSAAGVKFEDWKDRPSEFLREYGDPSAANGSGSRPAAGEKGNWACDGCSNINFPRRQNCLKCQTPRSAKAEHIVRDYVKFIIDSYN
mmetsp:Transcript_25022/g.34484  ORF Transcript_25022/g.34484 Transcript_25022/m.34484 type:complete len:276 (+) Transcript_25022:110-937(+)